MLSDACGGPRDTAAPKCSSWLAPEVAPFISISCPAVTPHWLLAVAPLSQRWSPSERRMVGNATLVNVGANKGYLLALWMALFSQRIGSDPRGFARGWHESIHEYARAHHKLALLHVPYLACGVCGACKDLLPKGASDHVRSNGVAHALEILPANVELMRGVVERRNLTDRVFVHHLAGTNESRALYTLLEESQGVAVASQAGRESNAVCDEQEGASSASASASASEAAGGTWPSGGGGGRCNPLNAANAGRIAPVRGVSLDDFFAAQHLGEAFVVSVDAEGHDPLVLEGMRRLLAAKRIAIVVFEKHLKGYWAPTHPERRTLRSMIHWLHDLGYSCFVEGMRFLTPISPPSCWLDAFEQISWSNVVCAHDGEVLSRLAKLQIRGPEDVVRDFVWFANGPAAAARKLARWPWQNERQSEVGRCWLSRIFGNVSSAA